MSVTACKAVVFSPLPLAPSCSSSLCPHPALAPSRPCFLAGLDVCGENDLSTHVSIFFWGGVPLCLLQNGVIAVVEGANMPTTNDATHHFEG